MQRSYIKSAKNITSKVHVINCKIITQLAFNRDDALVIKEILNLQHFPFEDERIKELIRLYVNASKIIHLSGFDGIEILDNISTSSKDNYQISFHSSVSFWNEVICKVKEVCGKNFIICQKIFIETDSPLSNQIKDSLRYLDCDALDVTSGKDGEDYWKIPPYYLENGVNRTVGKLVSELVNIPILLSGRLDNPSLALNMIEEGISDGIGLGRPLLVDPYLPDKIFGDNYTDIIPCLSCNICCIAKTKAKDMAPCSLNKLFCKETFIEDKRKGNKRKTIAVIGGGLVGLEVARATALKGHKVFLLEEQRKLGGKFRVTSSPWFKYDGIRLIDWYENELRKNNVSIWLGYHASLRAIESLNVNNVVIINDLRRKSRSINHNKLVINMSDVFENIDLIYSEDVIVIATNYMLAELALWLSQVGKNVTLMLRSYNDIKLNSDMSFPNDELLTVLLKQSNMSIIHYEDIVGINNEYMTVNCNGVIREVMANNIVVEDGPYIDNKLFYELSNAKKWDVLQLNDVSNFYEFDKVIAEVNSFICNL
jgi:2-enoate reductase